MIRPDRLVDEVHPGLWIGGSWAEMPADIKPFDLVLTVCRPFEARHPAPCRRELALGLDDIAYVEQEAVSELADTVVSVLSKGLTVLVRCAWGLNRSALVAGAAIAKLTDTSGAETIERMRAKRSPDVLSNATFERHLRLLAPERRPDAPADRIAWRTWGLTADEDGPRLATPYSIGTGQFVAGCYQCAEPPGEDCACGMYVMLQRDDLRPLRKDVIGQVVMHGRILPGPPTSAAACPGEYRASAVTLHGPQYVMPKYAHLVEPLSERYGVPFAVYEAAERLTDDVHDMLLGARFLGRNLDVDWAYLDSLPTQMEKRAYLGLLYQGWSVPAIKGLLGDGRSKVAA